MFSYQWVTSNGTTDTNIAAATDSTYTLVADDQGKTIKVQVSFTDDEGNDESMTSAATEPVGIAEDSNDESETLPAAPTSLVGRPYPEGIELQWVAPEGNVEGYRISRRKPDECQPDMLTYVGDTGNTETDYMDQDVIPGLTYVYLVHAINRAGIGTRSNVAHLNYPMPAADSGAPAAPTRFAAFGTHGAIELTWTAPSGDVTGYQILRRRPQECESALRVYVANTNSTDTQWWDEDVQDGTQYQYRVKAINTNGIGEWSRDVIVTQRPAVIAMGYVRSETSIEVGGSSTFDLGVSHLHRDSDPDTVDYILRGDVVAVLEDDTTQPANQCEGAGLGEDILIKVVDRTNFAFKMTFGGVYCNKGRYIVNVALSGGDGAHIMTLPVEYGVAAVDYVSTDLD